MKRSTKIILIILIIFGFALFISTFTFALFSDTKSLSLFITIGTISLCMCILINEEILKYELPIDNENDETFLEN